VNLRCAVSVGHKFGGTRGGRTFLVVEARVEYCLDCARRHWHCLRLVGGVARGLHCECEGEWFTMRGAWGNCVLHDSRRFVRSGS